MGDLRKTGYSGTMIFDPFAKRKTDCPEEVQERNYRQAFTLYCGECMETYGLQAGKLANRRVGECGICGKEGFLVGNLSNDSFYTWPGKVLKNAVLIEHPL